MEVATLPAETETPKEPPEEKAEAANTVERIFQYSEWVHVGAGAAECDKREGGCRDEQHFHAWVSLPNALQQRDIQEKSRAARARRKRAMREAGGEGRPPSDAYVTLEAELDELLEADREPIILRLAEAKVRDEMREIVREVAEEDRFEHYYQDVEEYQRLKAMDPEERPAEEWGTLDRTMTDFGNAVEERTQAARSREITAAEGFSDDVIRDALRKQRIEQESQVASINTYYLWLGYISTHPHPNKRAVRTFSSLEDYRSSAPEVVLGIESTITDLETRMIRGDAAGN